MIRFAAALLLFVVVLFAAATAEAGDDVLRVFVFAGQSNMDGADAHAREIDAIPTFVGAGQPQPKVRYWYMVGPTAPENGSGGWVPLAPTKNRQLVGPEITFARKVTTEISAPIAIIKSSWGGTTLAHDWNPDEPSDKRLYERTLTMVRTALAELDRQKIRYRLEGFVWHQGENDMLNRDLMTGYGERLTAFIARFRTDLGAPELPWFVGEISDKGIWGLDHRRNMQVVRAQQRQVAVGDPHVWFVATSHLAFAVMGSGQPHYHFGTEGQLQHGEAYARAYLKSVGRVKPAKPEKLSYPRGLPIKKGSKVRVVLVAGQRTAEGDGAYVADLSNDRANRKLAKPRASIPYRYRLGGGAFASKDWLPLGPSGELGTFGPELSLGASLGASLGTSSGRGAKAPVVLLKITNSAAALADWLPEPTNASRPEYAPAVQFVRDALDDLRRRGYEPELDGVFWIPGEHDCYWGPFRQRYGDDLATLIAALRKDLDAPTLRFWVAELSDRMRWGEERLNELDAQIERVAAADPRVWFVSTDDVPTPQNCVSFGTAGMVELGRVLGRAYRAAK